jgi:hypothetical protein
MAISRYQLGPICARIPRIARMNDRDLGIAYQSATGSDREALWLENERRHAQQLGSMRLPTVGWFRQTP